LFPLQLQYLKRRDSKNSKCNRILLDGEIRYHRFRWPIILADMLEMNTGFEKHHLQKITMTYLSTEPTPRDGDITRRAHEVIMNN